MPFQIVISKVTCLTLGGCIRDGRLRTSSGALCGIKLYRRETNSCPGVVTYSFLAVEEVTVVNRKDAYPSLDGETRDEAEWVDGLL